MVVSRFGVRAVVDKGGETCDQGGVFDGGVCLVAIVSSQGFKQFRVFLCMLHAILFHLSLQSGVGRQSGGGGGECG